MHMSRDVFRLCLAVEHHFRLIITFNSIRLSKQNNECLDFPLLSTAGIRSKGGGGGDITTQTTYTCISQKLCSLGL